MEPLISVIIPVYKVEKYIHGCIKSVCEQTYKNLEIILVDDGSPDDCGAICDEYEKLDDRIIVIHKENGGLSDARNVGIDMCHGEYISFIDSDDFVSPVFIETLYRNLRDSQADIASTRWPYAFVDGEEHNICLEDKSSSDYDVLERNDALKLILYQNVPNGAQHRLYKRSLFDSIRFPKGFLFEDVATVYRTFILAEKIVFTGAKIYAYRIRKDGIVRMDFSDAKMVSIPIGRKLFEDMCEYDIKLKKAAAARAFSINYQVFLQVPNDKMEQKKALWKEIVRYRKYVCLDFAKELRLKNRLAAIVSYLGCNMAHIIGTSYKKQK